MDFALSRLVRTAALLTLAACATPRIASSPAALAERMPFLRPGETRMEEALGRLGEPAFRHEAERTMIWVAGEDSDGRIRVVQTTRERIVRDGDEERTLVASTWSPGLVELVLQFDAEGTYVRGSLVRAE